VEGAVVSLNQRGGSEKNPEVCGVPLPLGRIGKRGKVAKVANKNKKVGGRVAGWRTVTAAAAETAVAAGKAMRETRQQTTASTPAVGIF
jgi:anti-sigma-K factor RskA